MGQLSGEKKADGKCNFTPGGDHLASGRGVLGEDDFAFSIQPRNDCMIHSAKTTFPLSLPWLALQTRLGRPRNPHNDTHNHSPSSGRGSKLV